MDTNNEYGTLIIQKSLLVLLKMFDQFCTDNGIKYSISSGTLLGAVRHHGFIPWDDDVDIITDRNNYEKLVSLLPDSDFVIERFTQNSLWIDRIGLQGSGVESESIPTLDVFIMDRLPDSLGQSSIKVFLLKMLQGMIKPKPDYSRYSSLNKVKSFVAFHLGRFFSLRRKLGWYHLVAKWGNNHPSQYCILSNDQYKGLGVKYPSYIMDTIIRGHFESIEINMLEKYDEYLTIVYGDYMTPPPDSKRKPSHSHPHPHSSQQ